MNKNRTLLIGTTVLILWFVSPIVSPAFKIAGSLLGFSTGDLYAADGRDNYSDNYSHEPVCGDGVVADSEICDDGSLNGQPGHCNTMCTQQLVAHYDFSDGLNDSSLFGNNGTANNGMTVDFMSNGNVFADFDGNGGYMSVPHKAILNTKTMTVSYWVKPSYQNYANKNYTVVTKGGNLNSEYQLGMIGKSAGFSIVNGGNGSPAQLSAPSNLVAEYGGLNENGKQIIYLHWDDNSDNEDGFVVEIVDQDNNCGNCPTTLPSNTTFFKALAENELDMHLIRVYAYKGAVNSEKISTLVRDDGNEPDMGTPPSIPFIPRDNKWHHVTQTRDGNGVYKYYVDGQLILTQTNSNNYISGNSPLLIGTLNPPVEQAGVTVTITDTTTIAWPAVTGQRYLVQYKENAAQETWSAFPDIMVASAGTANMVDDMNYSGTRIYKVLHLDEHAFKGGLDEIMIYKGVLSGSEITNLYLAQKDQFRPINNYFVGTEYFRELSGTKLSQAMDDLEKLSRNYESAWEGRLPESVTSGDEAKLYLQQKWERQVNFYVAQLKLMEKYDVMHGQKASDVLAIYQPIWQNERANNAWAQNSLAPSAQSATQTMQKSMAEIAPIQEKQDVPLKSMSSKVGELAAAAAPPSPPPPPGDGLDFNLEPCDITKSWQDIFVGPSFPFIYTALYGQMFEVHTQYKSLYWENGGITSDGDPFCSPPTDHLELDLTMSYKVTEAARWDVKLFDGINVTKLEYDIVPKVSPISYQQKTQLWYWYPDIRTDAMQKIANKIAAGAPPELPDFSGVASLAWSLSIADDGTPAGAYKDLRGWLGDWALTHVSKAKSITRADAGPYGDGITAKFHWTMDYVPEKYEDLIPAWAGTTANIIGALARPDFDIAGPDFNVHFGASLDNVFQSKLAKLKCDVDIGSGFSCGLEWDVVTHGKGHGWAVLKYSY